MGVEGDAADACPGGSDCIQVSACLKQHSLGVLALVFVFGTVCGVAFLEESAREAPQLIEEKVPVLGSRWGLCGKPKTLWNSLYGTLAASPTHMW